VTLTINGKARTFYFTPPNNGVFSYYYTPQYTPEPGLYGSLANTGDNCSGVLLHVGNVWECAINNSGQIYQATGYQYTDPYGRIYTLASDGTLQSIQDLNNNTLAITPTGITRIEPSGVLTDTFQQVAEIKAVVVEGGIAGPTLLPHPAAE
jgi:hypothetical protein